MRCQTTRGRAIPVARSPREAPLRRPSLADVRSVGLPRALMTYRLGAKWRAFFEALGREVVVSGPSDRGVLERGQALSVDECCLASKLYLGHVDALAGRVDAVFVPSSARRRALCVDPQPLRELQPLVLEGLALGEARVERPLRGHEGGVVARVHGGHLRAQAVGLL